MLRWGRPRAVSTVVGACALSLAIFLVLAPAAGANPMALDPSFGSGGTLVTPIGAALGTNDARANALALQPDGKLVAAGYAREYRNDKLALARYNPDGSLDSSFNGSGTVLTGVTPAVSEGAEDHLRSVVVQSDGKLVAVGYAAAGGQGEAFVIARYNADGSLDQTFNPSADPTCPGAQIVIGCRGVVPFAAGGIGRPSRATSVIVQADGKYVVGGVARPGGPGAPVFFALVRFNADGSLDQTFNPGGEATCPGEDLSVGCRGVKLTAVGNGGSATVNALALQPDGKIIAAGTAADGGLTKFALARFNSADGSLDTTFGSGGTTLTPVGSGDAELNSLVVDNFGRLVATGSAVDANGDHVFALARYRAINGISDGVLDTTFGSAGTTLSPIGDDGAAAARSVTTQGRQLLVAGVASDGGVSKLAFARFDAHGAPDTGFSATGSVLVPIGNGEFSAATSVVSDHGRPVAAGFASSDGRSSFALARLVPTEPAAQGASGGTPSSACFQRFTAVICPGATPKATGSCRLQTSTATMSRSGRISVQVKCTGAASGTLALRVGKKATIGRKSFSVKSARSMTLKLKLSKSAQRRVRKARRLRVQATVSHKGQAAASSTSKKLTIKAPKKR